MKKELDGWLAFHRNRARPMNYTRFGMSHWGRRVSFCAACALLGTALLSLSTGCVSATGDKAIGDPNKIAQIKAGQSTKADVRALVGEPMKVTFTDNGDEIWDYMYTRGQARATSWIPVAGSVVGGADVTTKTLTVRFTGDGVVKNVGTGSTSGGGGGVQDMDR